MIAQKVAGVDLPSNLMNSIAPLGHAPYREISRRWMWQKEHNDNHMAQQQQQAQNIAAAHSERSVKIRRKAEKIVVGMAKATGLL